MIPDGWSEARLGDLFDVKSSKRVLQSDWRSSGVPFYRGREITELSKRGEVDNDLFIDRALFEELSSRFGVPARGDILVSAIGTIGNVFLVRGDHEFYFKDASVLWLSSKGVSESSFVVQWMRSPGFQTQLPTGNGTTVDTLTIGILGDLNVPLPPLDEQRAIAEALSDADARVESLDALIAKKRDMKQAAMQQLLTGQTRLGGAETSWKGRKIGDLFSFKRTTALSRAQLSADGPCGYVHYGDIHSRWGTHLDLSHEVLPRCSLELSGSASYLEEGDLIMADASEDLEGVGRMVEVRNIGTQKAIAGLHTVLLRPVKGIFAPGFVGFISLMPDFVAQARTLAAGLKVYGLSKSALASIEVRVPDTGEQQLVSAVLLDMDAEIDALVAQREKAELVKQGMMQELLSGRVRLA